MDHAGFDAALKTLGYSRERFAEIVDLKSSTTVQNWATGTVNVPGPVATLVEYLLERKEARHWFEERRPPSAESKPRKIRAKSRTKDRAGMRK